MIKKYVLLILLFIIATTAAFAEKDANRVRQQKARVFGLTISYLQTSMYESAPLLSPTTISHDEYNRFHGIQGGIVLNPEFGAGVGILTGVQYVFIPTYSRIGKPKEYLKTVVSQHDLAVPFRIQYRYAFTPGFSIFAYTGPLFSVGLMWKEKSTLVDSVESETTVHDFYNREDNYEYNRFHAFWGIGAGMIFSRHIRAEVFADWGINNITPYSGKFTHLNRPISFAFSYMF